MLIKDHWMLYCELVNANPRAKKHQEHMSLMRAADSAVFPLSTWSICCFSRMLDSTE